MREMDLAQNLDAIPTTERYRGGRPFSDTIHRQNHRILERGGIECARRVTEVVLGKEQPLLPDRPELPQRIAQQFLLEQLLFRPYRQGFRKGAETLRSESEVSFQQSLELQEWLVIENDEIDIVQPDVFLVQTILDGMCRHSGVVLASREPFLLCGSNDLAIADQRCRTIVVKTRDAEDAHIIPDRRSAARIDWPCFAEAVLEAASPTSRSSPPDSVSSGAHRALGAARNMQRVLPRRRTALP